MASFHQSIALDSPIRSLHISFVYNNISMAPRFADLKITLWLSATKEYRNSVYSSQSRYSSKQRALNVGHLFSEIFFSEFLTPKNYSVAHVLQDTNNINQSINTHRYTNHVFTQTRNKF